MSTLQLVVATLQWVVSTLHIVQCWLDITFGHRDNTLGLPDITIVCLDITGGYVDFSDFRDPGGHFGGPGPHFSRSGGYPGGPRDLLAAMGVALDGFSWISLVFLGFPWIPGGREGVPESWTPGPAVVNVAFRGHSSSVLIWLQDQMKS